MTERREPQGPLSKRAPRARSLALVAGTLCAPCCRAPTPPVLYVHVSVGFKKPLRIYILTEFSATFFPTIINDFKNV